MAPRRSITASDGVLGGVRNTMTVYLSKAAVQVNINPSDTVVAYAPAPHIFGEEYIAEKLETKAGWNFASPDEDWVRGYPQELEDFVDSLLTGREPIFRVGIGPGDCGGDLCRLPFGRERDAGELIKI